MTVRDRAQDVRFVSEFRLDAMSGCFVWVFCPGVLSGSVRVKFDWVLKFRSEERG